MFGAIFHKIRIKGGEAKGSGTKHASILGREALPI
jgi:hypothetical protein